MKDIDRCKLPAVDERYMQCFSKDCPNEFCVWVNEFMKSEYVEGEEPDIDFEEALKNHDLAPDSYMKDIFTRSLTTTQKLYEDFRRDAKCME